MTSPSESPRRSRSICTSASIPSCKELGLGRDQGRRRRARRDRVAIPACWWHLTFSNAQQQEPQVAMTMPILVGTEQHTADGQGNLGNYIGVAEGRESQFGKIMSIPDEPMRQYFTLLTELPLAEVDRLLAPGVNPRDAKEALGKVRRCSIPRRGSRGASRRGVPPSHFRARSRRHSLCGIRGWQARRRWSSPGVRHAEGARTGIQHFECPARDRAGGPEYRA